MQKQSELEQWAGSVMEMKQLHKKGEATGVLDQPQEKWIDEGWCGVGRVKPGWAKVSGQKIGGSVLNGWTLIPNYEE